MIFQCWAFNNEFWLVYKSVWLHCINSSWWIVVDRYDHNMHEICSISRFYCFFFYFVSDIWFLFCSRDNKSKIAIEHSRSSQKWTLLNCNCCDHIICNVLSYNILSMKIIRGTNIWKIVAWRLECIIALYSSEHFFVFWNFNVQLMLWNEAYLDLSSQLRRFRINAFLTFLIFSLCFITMYSHDIC